MDDLEKVTGENENAGVEEEVLDPYALTPENKQKVSSRIDKKLGVDKFSRSQFERTWFRNIAMIAGQHDIMFEGGKFRLKRFPAWYPKTQTNKFKEKSRDLISALLTGRVPIKYLPATDDPEDAGTAEIGERVREVIYEESKMDSKENEHASWFINTGNSFLLPYYDYDSKHGEIESQKLECPQCQTSFGSQEMEEQGVDEENPTCPSCAQGGPPDPDNNNLPTPPPQQVPLQPSEETELLPIGALCVDICSSFEIRADSRIRDYKDWPWFIRQRRYDVSFAKEKWKYEGGENREEAGGSLSQHYLDIISQLNTNFDPQTSVLGGTSGASQSPKVTVFEYYQLPDEDFPEGLRAVRLGSGYENIVEMGPLSTEYGAGIKKGKKFLPIIHFRAEIVPGRLWGSTPLDDAVPLQLQRNTVERIIKLEVQRMANSLWLLPKGCGIDLTNGEPGWNATYNPITLGGTTPVKPERLPPQLQHLQMLIEWLKFIDDAIERVTGTYFLQGGDAPSGVTAASALSLLDDKAKKAMSPLVREWAKGYLAFDEMALELARQNWTDARIRVVAGKNRQWETSSFMAADLQGAVNMTIDYASLFPKSAATDRAEIQQLIQGMVLNPQEPEVRMQILKKFGMMHMLGSYDLDVKQAQKEWVNFQKGVPPQLVPLVQNSLAHFMEHCDVTKTDEFDALPPEQKQQWYDHITVTASDMGERRALFAQMGLNPDAPQAEEIGTGAAQSAIQGAQQVMSPQQGGGAAQPGSQVGSSGPSRPSSKKGTTGAGPNQSQAQQRLADIGAGVPPTPGGKE